MNIAFWNINGQNLTNKIVELIVEHDISILVLFENKLNPSVIVQSLNS